MKILLVGEFSGVHNNLKKGLIELGHEVTLAADGDGYKKFSYDFPILPFNGLYLGRILNLIYILINFQKFIGYDVVQFISPTSMPIYLYKIGLLGLILKRNKKVVYYACGTDPNYVKISEQFDYHPIHEEKKYSLRRLEYHEWFVNRVDIIVPATYSYYIGYKGYNNLGKTIMLPGSGEYISDIKSAGNKLKILFGITRRGFKGADFIEEALEMVRHKYDKRVEITIVERLPFESYKLLLDNTDILIDQCKSYFYGMNAIFAMERGVIVMSGAEKDAIKHLGIAKQPIQNIKPCSNQIFNQLEHLILLSNDEINELKNATREYVAKFHDVNIVASEFDKLYQKL